MHLRPQEDRTCIVSYAFRFSSLSTVMSWSNFRMNTSLVDFAECHYKQYSFTCFVSFQFQNIFYASYQFKFILCQLPLPNKLINNLLKNITLSLQVFNCDSLNSKNDLNSLSLGLYKKYFPSSEPVNKQTSEFNFT